MSPSLLSLLSLSLLCSLILAAPFRLSVTPSRQTSDSGEAGTGTFGEQCSSTADCLSSYNCVTFEGRECASADDKCVCVTLNFEKCEADEDCAEDEKCRTIGDFGRICTPRVSDVVQDVASSLVCIDADALAHMGRDELLFEEHQTANVLCDDSGSCATPGHVVRYRGVGMMMKSYCGLVGCVEKVIKVNSPRYRFGVRVPSKTEGLEYTAFAARYESMAEETTMAAAVRMGF